VELIRKMSYRDLKAHRDELRRHGSAMPMFWPLVLARATGNQVWEYSDVRGPLDGDGGFAVLSPEGKVIRKIVVWMS
jgi:hypothetical protein